MSIDSNIIHDQLGYPLKVGDIVEYLEGSRPTGRLFVITNFINQEQYTIKCIELSNNLIDGLYSDICRLVHRSKLGKLVCK